MKQIFPLIHLGCGVGSVFVNCLGVSQSWIDLWLQALFFSFQKYLTLPRNFGKGGLFVFMYFFCNLKASWIIKPVIFQACKCFQHVALFPESAHTVASWRTSVSPNHLRYCFPLGLWYLGCSFGKQTNTKTCISSNPPHSRAWQKFGSRWRGVHHNFRRKTPVAN